MTDWMCPNCRGGFPTPATGDDAEECPWCGQPLDASYEFEPVRAVARTEEDGDDDNGFLQMFR